MWTCYSFLALSIYILLLRRALWIKPLAESRAEANIFKLRDAIVYIDYRIARAKVFSVCPRARPVIASSKKHRVKPTPDYIPHRYILAKIGPTARFLLLPIACDHLELITVAVISYSFRGSMLLLLLLLDMSSLMFFSGGWRGIFRVTVRDVKRHTRIQVSHKRKWTGKKRNKSLKRAGKKKQNKKIKRVELRREVIDMGHRI